MSIFDQDPNTPLQKTLYRLKRLTGAGTYPDFMILGAQKAATTTLFAVLMQHPDVLRPRRKEPNYFACRYRRSLAWYRANFPSVTQKLARKLKGQAFHTCDASTTYLFHPLAPQRVHERLPGAKLIVLLREPVARAYSHYQFMCRLGVEPLSFEEAIAKEEERIAGEREKILADGNYVSYRFRVYSYKARGVYVDQLEAWTKFFPPSQILVLQTEAFQRDPKAATKRTAEFLGLSSWDGYEYKEENTGNYSEKMGPKTHEQLHSYYHPHNERLWKWLGETWDWKI